ncbi:Gfo/Idh/MocA family oxidoreductase [Pedobacter sp. BS3]|uniref:Gfo/Idh/MocA family protein n=1 Tax=Pedobacter sp. BS3 TaxID=2567937 RepID=UPI0011ECC1AD|nr:Gfo/Idh/MocA family oxidoreductase [Pedobacter sp. BS3]TZF84823.1 Gfo/Idh/MocA family oxidoreductase [Pedobacter sp. BS3]
MNTINWGIIGCGDVTEKKSGPAFNKVPNSKLVAVMRRDAEKARDYAQRHGVGKYYTDALQLINDPDVNAIYVATPPLNHEELTIAALQANKPVYVEKPMALNSVACRRMVEASERYNTKLTVAHYRRALPMFIKIKELLQQIGRILFVNIDFIQPAQSELMANSGTNWRVDPAVSGGGLFHDMAPHHIDILLYLFGDPVYAAGYPANQGKLYQADDVVSGIVAFNNQIVCKGLWHFNSPEGISKDECEITGTSGKIKFSFHSFSCTLTQGEKEETFHFPSPEHIQQPMIDLVVQYFNGSSTINPCPGEEGIKVMEVMDSFTRNNQ